MPGHSAPGGPAPPGSRQHAGPLKRGPGTGAKGKGPKDTASRPLSACPGTGRARLCRQQHFPRPRRAGLPVGIEARASRHGNVLQKFTSVPGQSGSSRAASFNSMSTPACEQNASHSIAYGNLHAGSDSQLHTHGRVEVCSAQRPLPRTCTSCVDMSECETDCAPNHPCRAIKDLGFSYLLSTSTSVERQTKRS